MRIDLSERQERVVATAVTLVSVVVILAAVGGLVWLAARFVNTFQNVLLPLAVAAVGALVAQPYFDWLVDRLGMPRPLALGVLFLSAVVPLVAFSWFFGALVVEQLGDLIAHVPGWWREGLARVKERWPEVVAFLDNHPVGQRLRVALEGQDQMVLDQLQELGSRAFSAGVDVLKGIIALLGWAVLPIYFAFFVNARTERLAELDHHLPFLKPETRRDALFLAEEFVNILVAFFRGQLTIAFLQGMLFALGFSLAGLRYGLVLGMLLGFLNIIPYLGSIVGLGVALPLALFQPGGGWWTLLWVIVVFTAVQMIEGYLLTPRIMGNRTGLHPLAIIVAVFFWGSALSGILGMILAIPLTAFLVVFWRLANEKYIDEWV